MSGTNWFGGLGGATPDARGNNVHPGTYLVKVEALERKVTKKNEERIVAIEFTILETLSALEAAGGFEASNSPGERCKYIIFLDRKDWSPLSKLKAFLLAFTGMEQGDGTDEEWEELAMEVTDPAQDFEERVSGYNRELVLVAGKTYTRGKNEPFTTVQWVDPASVDAPSA